MGMISDPLVKAFTPGWKSEQDGARRGSAIATAMSAPSPVMSGALGRRELFMAISPRSRQRTTRSGSGPTLRPPRMSSRHAHHGPWCRGVDVRRGACDPGPCPARRAPRPRRLRPPPPASCSAPGRSPWAGCWRPGSSRWWSRPGCWPPTWPASAPSSSWCWPTGACGRAARAGRPTAPPSSPPAGPAAGASWRAAPGRGCWPAPSVFPPFVAAFVGFTALLPRLPAGLASLLSPYLGAPAFAFRLPESLGARPAAAGPGGGAARGALLPGLDADGLGAAGARAGA